MNLQTLCFRGDEVWDRRIKEASNFCDTSHIHSATFSTAQLVLSELWPIDLDGHGMLSICLNIEQQMRGKPGYNHDEKFKVSYFNLDSEVSQRLYDFKKFDIDFQKYVANLLLDILADIDDRYEGRNRLAERREEIMARLVECGFQKEILLEKSSKVSKDRRYKAMVYLCLNQRIGEAIRVDLVKKSSGEVVASKWMTPTPGYVLRGQSIHRAYWEGHRFNLIMWKREPHLTAYIDIPE